MSPENHLLATLTIDQGLPSRNVPLVTLAAWPLPSLDED
jgi:hypothetical protein